MTSYRTAQAERMPIQRYRRIASNPHLLLGMRTWYDRSGKHSIVAVLISKDQKEVTLRRRDGKVIKVPLDNLSEADLRYLKK